MLRQILSLYALALMVSLPAQANRIESDDTAGLMYMEQTDGSFENAPLLSMHISGQVDGLVASISIRQTFENTSFDWVNGRYVFPMPEAASVHKLVITTGERIIRGVVKEKAEAKRVFEKAKSEGKKAGLLEQHRPNLFSMSVANIEPNSKVVVELTFVQLVKYDSGLFSLRLPTTITPRFIPGQPAGFQLAQHGEVEVVSPYGWASDTAQVRDASQITPPQTRVSEGSVANRFSLDLKINSGLPLASIESASHQVDITDLEETDTSIGKQVRLSSKFEPLDRDVLISWKPDSGKAPGAALFQQEFDGTYYSLLMLVPPEVNAVNALPRQVTFIVDSSGSMAGASMRQAKQSLRSAIDRLKPDDSFNIIDFDSDYRALFTVPQPVTAKTVSAAKAMVQRLDAGGGTEMYPALEYALENQTTDGRLQQIIFITDGAVGNEEALFKLIHQKLGDTRLFTVGIGSAPNSYFMSRAAKFGRGAYTFVDDIQVVKEKVDELFTKIDRPLVRDISTNWSSQVEQYPSRIADLYSGAPLVVLARSEQMIQQVQVNGSLVGQDWSRTINQPESSAHAENLDKLWARAKVADLIESLSVNAQDHETVKNEVIKLGLFHQLVTRFTSFVAVEEKRSRPADAQAKNKQVANLMPSGSTMAVPQTATGKDLLLWLGFMLVTLAWFLQRFATCRETPGWVR